MVQFLARDFPLQNILPALGSTQPPIQWVRGRLFPGKGADKPLTLPNAVVKNEWSYTSAPYMPLWHAQGQLYLYLFCIIFTLLDI